MYVDTELQFASAVALSTSGTGLALVGDVVDLGKTSPGDIGQGDRDIYLVIQVQTTVTSAGAATVEFDLVSDAQAAIAVDGSCTVHYKSPAIPKATLVAGYQLAIQLPMLNPPYERFLGIEQNVGTAALTAGKINAFLTNTPPGGAEIINVPAGI